jgi:hypothetical protein
MSMDEKYNQLVHQFSQLNKSIVKAEEFGLSYTEFESIIKEIEYDGLFKDGKWGVNGEYIFLGLTFRGRSFLEHDDKKQYDKIEKTEINHNHNVHVGKNNYGNIIAGSNNVVNSKFHQKFNALVDAIDKSNMENKDIVIAELNNKKSNLKLLKDYVLGILSKGVDRGVSSSIGDILGSLG